MGGDLLNSVAASVLHVCGPHECSGGPLPSWLWSLENLPQRSRMCLHIHGRVRARARTHTHTHTHTDSALKHGDCLRGDTVCRNQTPQPPQGLVITSLVKVSLVRRGSSSAELTPSLTLKEGPLRGVGSAEFAGRRRLSCPWQFLGRAPESRMSRRQWRRCMENAGGRGGYQRCPRGASGTSPVLRPPRRPSV